MNNTLKALIIKKFKDSELDLDAGRHWIDETVVLRVPASVERHEDQWIQRATLAALWAGCESIIRMIFLPSVDFRSRARKRMKTSALKRHENTMNHRRPRLLIAEIILHPNRRPVAGTIGVWPLRE
jgi:hypothetical protein